MPSGIAQLVLSNISSLQIAGTAPMLCSLLCYSWISSIVAHVIGQGIIVFYAFYEYKLNIMNKIYMVAFICGVTVGYAFYFRSYEYALRCGALQYARKNRVPILRQRVR